MTVHRRCRHAVAPANLQHRVAVVRRDRPLPNRRHQQLVRHHKLQARRVRRRTVARCVLGKRPHRVRPRQQRHRRCPVRPHVRRRHRCPVAAVELIRHVRDPHVVPRCAAYAEYLVAPTLTARRRRDGQHRQVRVREVHLQGQVRLHVECQTRVRLHHAIRPVRRHNPAHKLVTVHSRGGRGEAAANPKQRIAVIGRKSSLPARPDEQRVGDDADETHRAGGGEVAGEVGGVGLQKIRATLQRQLSGPVRPRVGRRRRIPARAVHLKPDAAHARVVGGGAACGEGDVAPKLSSGRGGDGDGWPVRIHEVGDQRQVRAHEEG